MSMPPRSPLAFETYPGRTAPVLAVHGISSTRKLWLWLHAAAPEITLLAPDLRGRGESDRVPGPFDRAHHVADLVALLDDQGLDRVHVVGMSMGGFVAVALAEAHPERVGGLTLVDGGPPMATAPGLTPELLPQVFAGRIGRLARPWGSVQDYRDYFCSDIAPLLDRDDPLLLDYLAHDLRADGTVRLNGEALLADGAHVWFGDNPWRRVRAPMHLLHASWGVGAGSAPAYGRVELDAVVAQGISTTLVPEVDHAGIIMSPRGAEAVAAVLRRALDADGASDAGAAR